ncbi:MAG TPA: ABC transporter [Opitutae bacterium]|jgi:ABC-type lipoprotein export system ATPase subunit|nr:ABC transporter [Opitutae bacterium]|tara:strand:+ start:1627 stop:2262 length:636 start_codon:yes stop_codon:yes gene_type:complete
MLIELNDLVPDPLPEKIVEASGIWGGELRIETRSKVLVSAQSGMGKSTLLHILYGLRQDYTGTAKVDGTCLRQFSTQEWERVRRERISLQFQDLRLFPNLSARENLLLLPQSNPAAPSLEEMAERLEMTPFLNQSLSTLSQGQRQRMALVRTLRKPFRFLMLDEPFSHLDETNQMSACSLIEEIVDRNQAGLLVSSLGSTPHLPFDQIIEL